MNDPNNSPGSPGSDMMTSTDDAAKKMESEIKDTASAAAPMASSAASNTGTTMNSSSTNNNQLLGALTYPLPIVGIIALVSESMKSDPVLRKHSVQSLALAVVLFVVTFIIGLIPIVGCLSPFIWLGVTIYYAIQAYQGKDVTIPFVTDFCKNQKWI